VPAGRRSHARGEALALAVEAVDDRQPLVRLTVRPRIAFGMPAAIAVAPMNQSSVEKNG
jgi:hypothetical protein